MLQVHKQFATFLFFRSCYSVVDRIYCNWLSQNHLKMNQYYYLNDDVDTASYYINCYENYYSFDTANYILKPMKVKKRIFNLRIHFIVGPTITVIDQSMNYCSLTLLRKVFHSTEHIFLVDTNKKRNKNTNERKKQLDSVQTFLL